MSGTSRVKLEISDRLKTLLPPLTADEKKRLEENLVRDGKVHDPLIYWNDGDRNVILDGMNRYEIATRLDIPYQVEPLDLGTNADYEEAEIWMLDRQLGRRNLLAPANVREIRGKLYNRLKREKGSNRGPKGQFDTAGGSAAAQVSARAGVSDSTVKRDGQRMANLDKCTTSVQRSVSSGAVKVSDAEIKTLVQLEPAEQNTVATALRKGQASSLREAMKAEKIKTPTTPAKVKPGEDVKNSAFTAKGQLEEYAKTLGRWLSRSPTIDEWRAKWPGKQGDKVVRLAADLIEALKVWRRGIK